jgi:hypothetical protein
MADPGPGTIASRRRATGPAAALIPTVVVVALAVVLMVPAIAGGSESNARHRDVVLWGLPAALAVVAAVARKTARPDSFWTPVRPALPAVFDAAGGPAVFDRRLAPRLLPWCAGAFLLDHFFLYIGHTTGWLTFTFGDQNLSSYVGRTALWALPACLAAGVIGWEATLRGVLLGRWAQVAPRGVAEALVCGVGMTLAMTATIGQSGGADPAYLAAAIVAAAAREAACTAIALGGGGVLAAGLYRGAHLYLEAFLVSDWYSLFFPAGNYVSSDPRLYAARAATAILAAALMVAGAWWTGRRTGAQR